MGLHIGGLSSGTDYASMIDQLMEARRVPIQSKEVKQSELDYDMGAWSEVTTLTSALSTSLDNLRYSSKVWDNMSVESSLESVVTASASSVAAEQEYSLVVTTLAKAQSISSDLVDTTSDLITGGYATEGNVFEIEGQQITIEAGETLSSLRNKINSAALAMSDENRVRASLVNNHLVLTRENSGAVDIALSDISGTTLQSLGVLDGAMVIKNENVIGTSAEFTVNGISVTRSSNSKLDDVIEGMTLNLKGVGSSALKVQPDRDAVRGAIEDFIQKYNDLAMLIDEYSKIDPGGSSEVSVTGELYGDTLLSSIKLNMRKMVTGSKSPALNETNASYTYEGETGIMDSLSDLGIWTYGEENRLDITDSSRFDDMLENEFENLSQLFKGVFDTETTSYRNGVASDFYMYNKGDPDIISSKGIEGAIETLMESKTKQYDDIGVDIEEMERALVDYEQELWDQFTRMEDALANMKSQIEYLNSMFNNK